jgi:hypothetical protein
MRFLNTNLTRTLAVLTTGLVCQFTANAELAITVLPVKMIGQKAIVPLTMKSTFTNKIDSARAQVFLFDAEGKVVGRGVNWVIGGAKDRPPLAPGGTNTYHFVIKTEKPFSEARVTFNRIVLEGGKLADPIKDVEVIK